MAKAAFSSTVKIDGPSTALTNEPCTKVTANTVYQITDSTKRILDPSVAIVVEVDADGAGAGGYAVAAVGTYTVDYLFGKITFASDQGSSATVRIASGSYKSPVDVAEAKEFSLEFARTIVDASYFVSDGYKRKVAATKDFKGSIKALTPLQTDQDPGAGTTKITSLFGAGTQFLLEVTLGGVSTEKFRGWVLIEGLAEAASLDALYEGTVNFVSAPVKGNGQTSQAVFGFGL